MKHLCFRFLALVLPLLGVGSLEAWTTKETFAKYPNKYFVESGSHVGTGIQMALDAGFQEVYSVELYESFYKHCCERFASNSGVKLYHGDTATVLPSILKEIDAPATFWLDGHYSGPGTAMGNSNTPLLEELKHIAQHPIKTHTLLIDDIRLLGAQEMDFITLEELKREILLINPNYEFSFEDGYAANDVLVAKVRNSLQH